MYDNEERNRRPVHRGSAAARRPRSHAAGGTGEQRQRSQREARPAVHAQRETRQAEHLRTERSASSAHASSAHAGGSYASHTNYGGNRRPPKKQSGAGVLIGIAVVLIAALAVVLVLFLRGKGGNPAETQTEEALRPDAIQQNAVIDLSAILSDSAAAGQDGAQAANDTAQSGASSDKETEAGKADSAANGENESDKAANDKAADAGADEAKSADTKTEAASYKLYVHGMTPDEIKQAVASRYTWNLRITNDKAEVGSQVKPTVDANETTEAATMGDAENPDSGSDSETDPALEEITVADVVEVPDLIAKRLDVLVDEIVAADKAAGQDAAASGAADSSESTAEANQKPESAGEDGAEPAGAEDKEVLYVLNLDDTDDELAAAAQHAADMWYVAPKGGSIGSYDAASDSFVMEGAKNGYKVDKEAMLAALSEAIAAKQFDAAIPVAGETLSADADGSLADYKIIGTYTTKTTANSVRNKNIQLAAEKLNGTIVQPGEEFSFNNTVGERTAAKGYGAAAAYNEGEVVQEIGGGICQVSTTLYNAVLRAGLKTTKRQSHTFVPSYVTPGFDATVSWGGPDYRFANVPANEAYSNTSSYAVGIKAHYANRTVTISIYGRPVLKDGYTYELSSKKVKDIDVVRKLIEPGSDKKPTKGTKGSQWTTNLVVKKNGEVVSDKLDHNTYYSGHIEYYTDEPESSEAASTEAPTVPEETIGETPAGTTAAPDPVEGPNGGPGVTTPQQTTQSPENSGGPGVSGPVTTEPGSQNGTAAPGVEAPGSGTAPGSAPGVSQGQAPGEPTVGSSPISNAPPSL